MSDAGREDHAKGGGCVRRVDVIVLIVIALILLGLILPAMQTVRDGHWGRTRCQNNLRQLALATFHANETYKRLPPLFGTYAKTGKQGTALYHLLPFLEESSIYNLGPPFTIDTEPASKTFGQLVSVNREDTGSYKIPLLNCWSDTGNPGGQVLDPWSVSASGTAGVSNYAANWLVFGTPKVWNADNPFPAWMGAARIPDSFPDGTAKTILFTEKFAVCNNPAGPHGGSLWAYPPSLLYSGVGNQQQPDMYTYNYGPTLGFWPAPFGGESPTTNPLTPYNVNIFQNAKMAAGNCHPFYAQSPHEGGINVAMADGHVVFVGDKASAQTWSAVLTPGPMPGLPGQPDKPGNDWDD
jgi:prepilin-type processing-associated H-X9-DG protein